MLSSQCGVGRPSRSLLGHIGSCCGDQESASIEGYKWTGSDDINIYLKHTYSAEKMIWFQSWTLDNL